MQDLGRQNIGPDLLKKHPVFYLHGRLVMSKLSWGEKTLLKIGAWLTKDPHKKKEMTTDFDDVKKEHLAALIETLQRQRNPPKTVKDGQYS